MKKLILLLVSLSLVFALSACSLIPAINGITGENKIPNLLPPIITIRDSGEKLAISRMEQIFAAIEAKDRESIIEMFSPYAQSEAEDLDGAIQYLFDNVCGTVESWEKIGGNDSKRISAGKVVLYSYRYRFYVYTPQGKYSVSIYEYIENMEDPSYIGVYSIKIFDAELDNVSFTDPGIYVPES